MRGSWWVILVISIGLLQRPAIPNNAISSAEIDGYAVKALAPVSITNEKGGVSGGVARLNVKDQSGTADDPTKYVLFKTPATIYQGYRTYKLPTTIPPKALISIQVRVNYNGPLITTQTWTWRLYDWVNKRWIKIGDNTGVIANRWNYKTFNNSTNPSRFINPTTKEIRLRLISSNASNDAKLDYEAIAITYDNLAPAAITDLKADTGTTEGSIKLSWTASGDDGKTGKATSYLVRYSKSTINTQVVWNAATPVTSGIPTPKVAGSSESMTVSGLTPGTKYYFNIRTQDEVLNLSGLSNSPSGIAKPDTTAPAAITNLAATTGVSIGMVNLTWTAPGDNWMKGTASSYLVRYSATAINDQAAWENATPVTSDVPTPQAAGEGEQMTVTGLTAGATYYFAVRAQDEVPNLGGLSNSPSGIAKTDTTAPATITDMAATTGVLIGTANLTWTAPGDNGTTGTASSYLVRYSLTAISNQAAWNNATPVTSGVPVPKAAGQSEAMTVSGLTAGTTYYFTVRAQDEVPNLGGISNSPSAAAKAACGNISTNMTWEPANNPYIVTCDVIVASGVTLTILPGVEVRFNSGAGLTIYGTLIAEGTSAQPILFTANTASPTPGCWNGISFSDTSSNSHLDHAIVQYGGGGGNVKINSSVVQITNSTIKNSSNYGIYGSNITSISLTGNTFTNNTGTAVAINFSNGTFTSLDANSGSGNGRNGISLSGTIGQNTTLPLNLGFPYIFSYLSVKTGVTLTLPAGSVIKMEDIAQELIVRGTLLAQGTSADSIYFTSIKDDSVGGDTNNDGSASSPAKGDWGYISVYGGITNFDYTVLRYGGQDSHTWVYSTLQEYDNSQVTLNHSTISNSIWGGIDVSTSTGTTTNLTLNESIIENNSTTGIQAYNKYGSGTYYITVTNSTIRNNNGSGVTIYGPNTTAITGSIIAGNTGYGVYNSDGATTINARNNWWGSPSGPAPYGSGNGINYDYHYDYTCDCYIIDNYYVDVSPWLGSGGSSGQSVAWNAYVAEPVNTAIGNYSYQRTDLSIPTRSFPLTFSRSYNSATPADGLLGYGWTYGYNVSITESSLDSSATVTYGDGRTVRFEWNGASYVSPAGTFSALVKSGGLFTLTEKDQTVYGFDASNRLSTITDKNSNVTILAYSGVNLASVTAPDGRILTLAYDGSYRIAQVTDPLGRTLGFSYDGSGDLFSFTDLLGKVTTYAYDSNHRLTSITDANNHTFVTNTYNSDGRVSQQLDTDNNVTTFVYDIVAHKTMVTDPRGNTTTYEYDASLRLTKETDPLGQSKTYTWDASNNRTSITDRRGNTTTFTYDSQGNVLTVTNPLGGVTTRTYDSKNNLLSVTDPLGRVTNYTYNVSGNLTGRTDALSGVTTYTYYTDANRNGLPATLSDPLSRVTNYDYNTNGDLTSSTDALNQTITRNFDDGGRLLFVTDPLGHATSYTYDAANHILTVTDALSGVTSNTYDLVGNLITTTDPLGHVTTFTCTAKDQVETVTDTAGYVTTYTYDLVGNRISVTDGNGHTTTYTYDGVNRVTGTTNPLGKTTTFTYDANGNRSGVTDPLGHTTSYTYDALNRQTVVTDPLGHMTTTTYDAVGNVTSVTDANTHTTTYTYDGLDSLITVTDASSGEVSYTYDTAGNRLSMTDANSHSTTYTYDALNRLLTETDPLDHIWSYTYDEAGRRTNREDANGDITSYTYDDANRLTGISAPSISITYNYDLAGNRTSLVDATGTTSYTYDELNRPTAISQSNGVISYGYDAVNRTSVTLPGSRTTTYAHDAADQLTSVSDWNSQVTTYAYDNAGRLTTTTFPNGVTTTNSYDNADRLTAISTVKGATTILSVTYTLDNVGNRLTMVEPSGTTSYTYDELNRLTSVTYPSDSPASVSYTYDQMGNRLTMVQDGYTTSYNYDAADRLTGITGGSSITFTWDNAGQMLTKGSQTFTWDTLGRMTGLTNGGTTAGYGYNGDGVRMERTVSGTTTSYLQDLAAGLPVVLAETTGGSTSRYIYGADLIAQSDDSATSYYHADGLGSTRVLTDSSGTATDQYIYDAFGYTRTHTGASANAFTYAGEQVDPEVGLEYLRARYYDSTLGRFISRDPFPGILVDTPSLNKYIYGANNPVLMVDDDGEFVIPLIVIGVAGYSAYQAWDSFLDRANQMETNMSGYYEFDFENPEWQKKYENYNPAADYASTLAAGVHAGVSTPGTSLSGPPPGITGSIGLPSLITTIGKKIMNWLFGFKGPEPYRFKVGRELQQVPLQGYQYNYYGNTWYGPPSGGK